jgi:GPH family glycoside/pentoside/hexuronide:cation symporter
MYAAPVPMALAFALLFRPPPGLSHAGLFAWLATFAVGVRIALTLYMLPSNAMVPELTASYDERTSLVSWRFLFGWLGGIVVSRRLPRLLLGPRRGRRKADASRYAGFGLAADPVRAISRAPPAPPAGPASPGATGRSSPSRRLRGCCDPSTAR